MAEPSARKPREVAATALFVVACALIVLGTVMIWLLEAHRSFSGMGVGEKVLAAFFQSVTTRTAGFNTVDGLHVRAMASKRAFQDRFEHLGDAALVKAPWERLASRDRAPLIPVDRLRRDPHLEMHTRGG